MLAEHGVAPLPGRRRASASAARLDRRTAPARRSTSRSRTRSRCSSTRSARRPQDIVELAHAHGVKVAALVGRAAARAQAGRGRRRHHRRPGHRGRRPHRRDLDDGARARGRRRGRAGARCSPPAASATGRQMAAAHGARRRGRVDRIDLAHRRRRPTPPPVVIAEAAGGHVARHRALARRDRQARAAAAHRVDRRVGGRRTRPGTLPMPLQYMLDSDGAAPDRPRPTTTELSGIPGRPDRRHA